MNPQYKQAFEGLLSGTLAFDAFARVTAPLWTDRAKRVMRYHPLPPAISVEDVAQVMLLGAWQASNIYDASRTRNGASWACWHAITRATKWLKLQRQANVWNGPSRFPVAIDQSLIETGRNEDGSCGANFQLQSISVTPGDSVERLIDADRLSRQLSARLGDRKSLFADVALRRANWDLDRAASLLYSDRTVVRSVKAAKTLVNRYAEALIDDLANP